jgi:hypothetical protein
MLYKSRAAPPTKSVFSMSAHFVNLEYSRAKPRCEAIQKLTVANAYSLKLCGFFLDTVKVNRRLLGLGRIAA